MIDGQGVFFKMSHIHDIRMERFQKAGVYLVTSANMSRGRSTLEVIKSALSGGIRLIQLREKNLEREDFMSLAVNARRMTADFGSLLIINDRIDVAQEIGADGVHLGQNDFPIDDARKLAPDLIIGASTHSIDEALKAQSDGASYINIGPLFPTQTKEWNDEFLGIEGLKRISSIATIPFTVMGGIKKCHIPELKAAGARIVAVVTEITGADDPENAARTLLSMMIP